MTQTERRPAPGSGPVPPIESYAVIGDCRSAALVSSDAAIDWLCWPRFDSPPVFSRLLDPRGGTFAVTPATDYQSRQEYRPYSNVLVTTFETPSGTCRITDLMAAVPLAQRRKTLLPESLLIRRVEGLAGSVSLELNFEPRGDFGRSPLNLRRRGSSSVVCSTANHLLHLASTIPLPLDGPSVRTRLAIEAGQSAVFALSYTGDEPAVFPPLHEVDTVIAATDGYWRDWAARVPRAIRYHDAVVRGALLLKLLAFAPSGAVVAAPTTSLPEVPGGDRNWDYRYCWLRDASLTVHAFQDLGYEEEAGAFAAWILHATRLTRPRVRVLYDVFGRSPAPEEEVEGLSGYAGARPVRAGNLAQEQVQLDVYGEIVEAVAAAYEGKTALSRDERVFIEQCVRYAAEHWRDPDSGIWESRGPLRHYVESRVMCWLAVTRGADLAERGLLRIEPAALRSVADEIRNTVVREGFSHRTGSFRQAFDSEHIDAALLRLLLVGFCDASDPMMDSTIASVRERLAAGELVFRTEDESRSGEGAFVLCSFWLVECLARQGRLDEAEHLLECLVSRANDAGLYAEEIDARTGGFLGNFPLAFSHVGLINAAVAIGRARRG